MGTTSQSKYHVVLTSANGFEIDEETDNLYETIRSFQPDLVRNKIILKVSTDKRIWEQIVFAPKARKLFFNNLALQIFVRNIERALQ